MFEMFRGGKPDPMTLMAVEQEGRKSDLDRIIRVIRDNYTHGMIDIEDVGAECGVYNLTDDEINYIEQKLNRKWWP